MATRIKRAYDEGRIGAADRDIRLGNVSSAQSMAELDLMSRDLDQLEAALPASSPAGGVPGAPYGTFEPKSVKRSVDVTAVGSPGRLVAILGVVVALVVLVGAVVAFVGYRLSTSSGDGSTEAPPAPAPGQPVSPDDTDVPSPDPGYELSGSGISEFLALYRRKFHTSLVMDLTLYDDYAVVNVPVPGKARQSGWLFRHDSGWTSFGGVRATFPGSAAVDTNRLDVPSLVRNIARARRTLNVESPTQAYVIIRFIPRIDAAPSADIHVINRFRESGYLATTIDGTVERAYPYAR